MSKVRKKHNLEYKAKVALAAIREQETVAEIARRYQINATVVHKWKKQLLENLTRVFETEKNSGSEASDREAELLRKIGELTVERDFLANGLGRFR